MKTLSTERTKKILKKQRVHIHEPFASINIKRQILSILKSNCLPTREILLLCIGTDRSTGDSLGPLIGTELMKFSSYSTLQERFKVLGHIHEPVHAVNLEETKQHIYQNYVHPYIIAIDAGLGKKSSVGTIEIESGPLRPGSGVQKDLGSIGDMHVTGYINIAGYMEHFVLQSTRLSLVIDMAKLISTSLIYTINEYSFSYTSTNKRSTYLQRENT